MPLLVQVVCPINLRLRCKLTCSESSGCNHSMWVNQILEESTGINGNLLGDLICTGIELTKPVESSVNKTRESVITPLLAIRSYCRWTNTVSGTGLALSKS